MVSKYHAKIEVKQSNDGKFTTTITDLDTLNGTYVNDKKITSHVLTPGDVIVLGSSKSNAKYKYFDPNLNTNPQDQIPVDIRNFLEKSTEVINKMLPNKPLVSKIPHRQNRSRVAKQKASSRLKKCVGRKKKNK